MLFANDHDAGRTFIFDVNDPLHPKVVTSFTDMGGFMHPHSYLRLPNGHVLASVDHVFNAVFVRGDVVGDTLFYGRGAGKDATASAVMSDLADAALDLKFDNQHRVPPFVPHECTGAVLPIEDAVSEYFVRLNVVDRPGVLAKIATIFGESKIGISSVIQPEGHEGESVPLIFMLHYAPNGAAMRALKKIGKLPTVKGEPVMIRVENFE